MFKIKHPALQLHLHPPLRARLVYEPLDAVYVEPACARMCTSRDACNTDQDMLMCLCNCAIAYKRKEIIYEL